MLHVPRTRESLQPEKVIKTAWPCSQRARRHKVREAAHEPKKKPLAAAFDIARLSGRGFALHVVLAEKTAFSIFVEGLHTPLFLMD